MHTFFLRALPYRGKPYFTFEIEVYLTDQASPRYCTDQLLALPCFPRLAILYRKEKEKALEGLNLKVRFLAVLLRSWLLLTFQSLASLVSGPEPLVCSKKKSTRERLVTDADSRHSTMIRGKGQQAGASDFGAAGIIYLLYSGRKGIPLMESTDLVERKEDGLPWGPDLGLLFLGA